MFCSCKSFSTKCQSNLDNTSKGKRWTKPIQWESPVVMLGVLVRSPNSLILVADGLQAGTMLPLRCHFSTNWIQSGIRKPGWQQSREFYPWRGSREFSITVRAKSPITGNNSYQNHTFLFIAWFQARVVLASENLLIRSVMHPTMDDWCWFRLQPGPPVALLYLPTCALFSAERVKRALKTKSTHSGWPNYSIEWLFLSLKTPPNMWGLVKEKNITANNGSSILIHITW